MSENSENLPVPTSPASSASARQQRPLWIAIVLLVLAVLALALFLGNLWQQRQALEQQVNQISESADQLSPSVNELSRAVDEIGQSVREIGSQRQTVDSQVTDRLDELETNLEQYASRQQALQRQLEQASRALRQTGKRTRSDWLLAEAEYLMRLANQRLRMERDVDGALALLQNADQVLEETEDMGIYPVRQELAREIQALRAVESVDRVGLYLQLEAAIEQIEDLTIANLSTDTPPDQAAAIPNVDVDPGAERPLQEAWQEFKQTLSEVVVVRRLDEPLQPLLSPRQGAYVNLNLRLMLEEAEMALLSADPVLYRRSLEKAREWLLEWYDESNSQVASLAQTLEDLAQRKISPQLPDISDSLNLLKDRISSRAENVAAGDPQPVPGQAGGPEPENGQGGQPQPENAQGSESES